MKDFLVDNKIKLIFSIVLISLLAISGFFTLKIKFNFNPAPEDSKIASDKLLAKVGEEQLYYRDLYAYAQSINFATFTKEEKEKYKGNSKVLVGRYLQSVIDQSILLQEGKAQNIIKVEDNFFTNTKKDYNKRKELALQVKEAVGKQLEKVTVESLTIYYNTGTSAIVAKKALEDYKSKLATNSLNFEAAGKQIAENPALSNLSVLNKNSYKLQKDLTRKVYANEDPQLIKFIFDQEVNVLSPAREIFFSHRNAQGKYGKNSVGFAVFKIISRSGTVNQSFDNWLQAASQKYNITREEI